METKQIFISYSSKDQDIAYKICSLLEGENMTCWIAPRDVTGGKSYGREILEAISNAQVVLFIFPKTPTDPGMWKTKLTMPSMQVR